MSSARAVVAPTRSIIYLGLDVHKESITIAVLPEAAVAVEPVVVLNWVEEVKRLMAAAGIR
jgi:hypothetical protein